MGQRIIGAKTPWTHGCGSLIGVLLVGAVCIALLLWMHWPRR